MADIVINHMSGCFVVNLLLGMLVFIILAVGDQGLHLW
jgi:hypothetical protein